MPEITFQTVTLQRGKHASPDQGACAMELASMLAGEAFSDRPLCASRVIGGFLRAYNDRTGDRYRSDLLLSASNVVGSAARPAVEAERIERLLEWGDERLATWGRGPISRARRRVVLRLRHRDVERPGAYAALSIETITDGTHGEVLALLDELLAIGATAEPVRVQPPVFDPAEFGLVVIGAGIELTPVAA